MIAAATIALRWSHPVLGEITEALCSTHNQEVSSALRCLGIYCLGCAGDWGSDCGRCVAADAVLNPWDYLVFTVGGGGTLAVDPPQSGPGEPSQS